MPAKSVGEGRTERAAFPISTFRQLMAGREDFHRFMLDEYTRLLASLFSLIGEVAFAPLEQRLARRLLIEADPAGLVAKTHQQLAADLGSVREVVSRVLGEWADRGLVELRRGQVAIIDRAALAGQRPH